MTALFKKLNYKVPADILVINAPASFEPELAAMSEIANVYQALKNALKIDFVMLFVTKQDEIEKLSKKVFPHLRGDAVIWFCYPKGSSKRYKCDFNRDSGWKGLGKYDLEPVRQVAIDEDWSALRFRKIEFIKTLTRSRSYALSEEGKRRTKEL